MAGRSGLRVALLAAIFSVAASKPIVQPINDVTMKACPTSTCTPVNVQITVGHQTPDFDITKLSITEIKITPLNPLQDAPFSAVISVRSDGTQRVIALSPKGKIFGTARITVLISDSTSSCTVAADCSDDQSFTVIVQPLAPVFDNAGPARTLLDFKTMVGTPTYPYTFLVGHEDEDKLMKIEISGSSRTPDILPNTCCSESASYQINGGLFLTLAPYNSAEDLSFVVGEFVVKARKATIVIRPSTSNAGNAQVTFRLVDGPANSQNVALATVTVQVLGRPTMETFCAHDVKTEESLQSIADVYGMHWMTLFIFNNHTLSHPDQLVPGSRLSIGRPYIVKRGDSLYSIATQYGTTWQHVKALNPAIILDEKSLFEGQLLCLAPDLAFITCRHRF